MFQLMYVLQILLNHHQQFRISIQTTIANHYRILRCKRIQHVILRSLGFFYLKRLKLLWHQCISLWLRCLVFSFRLSVERLFKVYASLPQNSRMLMSCWALSSFFLFLLNRSIFFKLFYCILVIPVLFQSSLNFHQRRPAVWIRFKDISKYLNEIIRIFWSQHFQHFYHNSLFENSLG